MNNAISHGYPARGNDESFSSFLEYCHVSASTKESIPLLHLLDICTSFCMFLIKIACALFGFYCQFQITSNFINLFIYKEKTDIFVINVRNGFPKLSQYRVYLPLPDIFVVCCCCCCCCCCFVLLLAVGDVLGVFSWVFLFVCLFLVFWLFGCFHPMFHREPRRLVPG